jgi:hypothetical protein
MGRVKNYYHDLIRGEFENVPYEYQMTPSEREEFVLEQVNLYLKTLYEIDDLD